MSETTSTPVPVDRSAAAETSAKTENRESAYPAPADRPTQEGPHGIRYDFNMGCRIFLPEGKWHVRLRDSDSGNIVFETDTNGGLINSRKRHFVRFRIEIARDGGPVFDHDYDARGRTVAVQFPLGTLGDVIGWFPYAVRFQEDHGCHLVCPMSELLIPLFKDAYPHITFVAHKAFDAAANYATYCLGLFFDDHGGTWQPTDFRIVGLHRTAGYILGVDPTEFAPKIALPDESRPVEEPYVVIAVQSSTQAKYWNNPTGWYDVVKFLKESGYRVICIDQRRTHGQGLTWNHIPYGVEDHTGDRPLTERARWLRHAAFFVGLSSGLSWLAWAAGTPVVMISGFTHPTNEFTTPFRIVNWHACNSCWNDVRVRFDHKNFFWCPRHENTPRQFECTRLITAAHVINTIKRVPGFGQHAGAGVTRLAAE